MKRRAILSVYDKREIETLAKGLVELGYGILSTGGTASHLREHGVELTEVSDYTGHPEILGGRVKSLHPKIHGGILARRENPSDMKELSENEIDPIDVVVVNLYPFFEKSKEVVATGKANHGSLVESIDIGGPTMIRAAAKNAADVIAICDPDDYPRVLEALGSDKGIDAVLRRSLAEKVFGMMRAYDGAIARYFALGEQLLDENANRKMLAAKETLALDQVMSLRYGENPHQSAGLYREYSAGSAGLWKQLQGKELSYNNLLDMYGCLDLFLELDAARPKDKEVAVVIKHSNPCGAALADNSLEAFIRARACDPLSAFGGIVALSGELSKELAESILEGFVEVLLVSSVSDGAKTVLEKKKNLRLIQCDFDGLHEQRQQASITVRNFHGDYLVQTVDETLQPLSADSLAAGPKVDAGKLADMEFAWKLAKHVKSNTIVIVKDLQGIGIGAGQMSRVDAARIAVQRAKAHGHSIEGAVAASDAFLPFPDTLEILAEAGVSGLVQPGGSIKDKVVIEAANKLAVSMLLTGQRHFRH